METALKVGFIGLGQRGSGFGMTDGSIGLLGNVLNNTNVLVTAVCDLYDERLDFAEKKITEKGYPSPLKTKNYRDVIKSGVDAVIVVTSWKMHVEVALECMKAGVAVAIEVGGTHCIDDCLKLVERYEETKTPFFFMENCCYNKDEILVTSLVRNGVLGDISFCQGGYCHDLREEIIEVGLKRGHYRLEEYKNHNCENYPTHELGPIAKILNINRGNRFTKLVSMSSKAQGLKEYVKNHPEFQKDLEGVEFKQGDVVTTMISCENGETVLLKLDTTLPRLYDRNLTVSGTKGFYCQTTGAVILDGGEFKESDPYKKAFFSQDKYNEYLSEDWKNITAEQLKTGHGGMDFVMLKHFFKAVKEKREMPIDVYDAATWMCVTALSEESIRNGSAPVDFPDFTRGAYKNRKPVDCVEFPVIKK